jgi:hypothetical protein
MLSNKSGFLCSLYFSSVSRTSLWLSMEALHHHGNALPAPDARRGQPVLLLSPA